jgi:hypothetical protein
MSYLIPAFVAGLALTVQVGVNSTVRILGAVLLFSGVLLIVR